MRRYVLGAVLVLVLLASSALLIPDTESPPVVIITLESARANNIPCYGYERNTAPNTCGLAEDGVLFENGYANGPHTFPSISAMMTSRYPNEIDAQPGYEIEDNVTTLAELMGDRDYRTYGITHTYINSEKVGLDKGFDHYEDRNSYDSIDVVHQSRKKVNTGQNFFLWAHMVDPHQGYSAPENFSGMFAGEAPNISADQTGKQFAQINLTENQIDYIEARYDEEIRYSDYAVGKMLEWLKKEGVYKDSLIILVGDHGEDFMEQRRHIGHGQTLRELYIHVPFVVKFPGNRFAGRRVSQPVSLLDVMPTVGDSLENDFNHSYRGESIYDIIHGDVERRGVRSQMYGQKSLSTKNWIYIDQKFSFRINSTGSVITSGGETEKLYNLSKPIVERSNVAGNYSRRTDYLSKLMYRKINSEWNEEIERLDPYLR